MRTERRRLSHTHMLSGSGVIFATNLRSLLMEARARDPILNIGGVRHQPAQEKAAACMLTECVCVCVCVDEEACVYLCPL